MAEFTHLRAIAVIQVLLGAEDFNFGNAGLPDLLEPDRG